MAIFLVENIDKVPNKIIKLSIQISIISEKTTMWRCGDVSIYIQSPVILFIETKCATPTHTHTHTCIKCIFIYKKNHKYSVDQNQSVLLSSSEKLAKSSQPTLESSSIQTAEPIVKCHCTYCTVLYKNWGKKILCARGRGGGGGFKKIKEKIKEKNTLCSTQKGKSLNEHHFSKHISPHKKVSEISRKFVLD